jgi:cytochrome c peroxidase
MSCAECHAPATGFTGPNPGINRAGAVYPGAVPQRFGNRKPPASSYATFSPIFHFDAIEGLFVGGNFWDGRATGEYLGNPAADQALGPFLNPVEQNNPSRQAVLEKIAASKYASLWTQVWGEPIRTDSPANIEMNYGRVGLAIAAYEASYEVNPFSSKFDYFWANALEAGKDVTALDASSWPLYKGLGLEDKELLGFALFNDASKGNCSACHTLDPAGPGLPPLFTDNTFDNLGVPRNPDNPFYDMDAVYLDDGSPINPMGAAWIDPGLSGFLVASGNPAWEAMAAENYGKHRVPTLRNVGKRPNEQFAKAYTHNGALKSLVEVVRFYNTRDVANWPAPEVMENMNTDELGNLGLSKKEEVAIATFLETLSDGWNPGHKRDSVVIESLDPITLTPNPFNPQTRITYTVPRDGLADLSVYDVGGRRVKVLASGWTHKGVHTVDFSASGMASGVYFVRIATAGTVRSARAILLK